MDLFTKLFGDFLVFVYHCFDRIVIRGYLTALSRPELVVHFFREIVGVAEVSKEALNQRTADYQNWVEAYARNHAIPIEWAEKGVRKEDHVLPWLRRMEKRNAYGVYFIFKSMEQGPTFRISLPKYPAKDPHYRIVAHQRSRFTHYYFYVRDEGLGPMVVRVASFFPFQTTYYLNGHSFIEQELKRAGIGFRKEDNAFLAVDDVAALQASADRLSPEIIRRRLDYWTLIIGPKFSKKERAKLNLSRFYAISQIEYCRNFIFRRHFPIHKLFERSCELGLWRLSADKIATIFGKRVSRRMHGKLATVIDQIEHGHHVFRAYFKSGFLKQYEKFLTFLRNELVSRSRSNGPKRGYARRTTCCRGCAAWRSAMPTVSTSSSRAWSKGRPSASACRSTRPRTRTTASSRTSAAASRITTSMSATRGSDRRLCGWLPYLLSQRPQLHRAGAEAGGDRLPQGGQRFPRRRRRRGAAGIGRPAEPRDHPPPPRLLDPDHRTEILKEGARQAQPVTLLRHLPDRVLPQLHLQASLSHPQAIRAQLRTRPVAAQC